MGFGNVADGIVGDGWSEGGLVPQREREATLLVEIDVVGVTETRVVEDEGGEGVTQVNLMLSPRCLR